MPGGCSAAHESARDTDRYPSSPIAFSGRFVHIRDLLFLNAKIYNQSTGGINEQAADVSDFKYV